MIQEFFLPGEPIQEQQIQEQFLLAAQNNDLFAFIAPDQLQRIQSAILQAAQEALDYNQSELAGTKIPICVRVSVCSHTPQEVQPANEQPPGWGYFVVNKLLSETPANSDTQHHLIEVFLYPEG